MSVAGRLLVATPPMNDPNFERSVIYMLRHDDDGAFGVVISFETAVTTIDGDDSINEWVARATAPCAFFEGGPVQRDQLLGIARFADDAPRDWASEVGHGIHTVDLNSDSANALDCARLRIFVGYSGWGPGQLDGEIAAAHWFVVDAHADDPFDAHPDTLWRRVLERDPAHRDWVRNFPDDPEMN